LDDKYELENNFYANDYDDFKGLYANLSVSTHTNNNNRPLPFAVPSDAIQSLAQLMNRKKRTKKS
jgi:hypothetical protein